MINRYQSENILDSSDLRNKFLKLLKRFRSVNEVCKTLNISNSAYYGYMRKSKREGDLYIVHRKFAQKVNDIKKLK